MDCYICHNLTTKSSGLTCPACARAALYSLRVKVAESMLARELSSRQVMNVSAIANNSMSIQDISTESAIEVQEAAKLLSYNKMQESINDSRDKIDCIMRQSQRLKEQIESYKIEIEEKKIVTAERRKSHHAASNETITWPKRHLEPIEKFIRRGHRKYDALFAQIISDRVYLCKEAAVLADLRNHKRQAGDGTVLDAYSIGGLPIADLRDINNASPQQLTASLTHICRLVKLTCNYLHIRLPSEITLPHHNYPLPTIFSPSSSYQNRQVSFPPTNPSSPTASRILDPQSILPRPRPLYINKKLPQLAREDPARYVLFIEGLSLLAWDIVWLCRTQGIPVASNEWEEVCSIGKNLYSLFVEMPRKPRPPLSRRATSSKDVPTLTRQNSTPLVYSKPSVTNVAEPFSSLGVYSHGTSHKFLGSATALANHNVDLSSRTWEFASPVSIYDRLRNHLAADMSGQEWEVLDERELGEDYLKAGRTDEVIVGDASKRKGYNVSNGISSYVAERDNSATEEASKGRHTGRVRGNSGWMKLKNRPPA